MNNTAINWTELTWNPMSGCKVVSTECKHCYAESLAEQKRGTKAFPNGFDLTLRPHKLREPSRIKAPSLIFCNSMSDLGFEDLTDDYRDKIFDAIEETPRHRYQTLTKRPQLIRAYLERRGRKLPRSVWMGVTVGHISTVDRIDELRRLDGAVSFLSCEPLLSDIGPEVQKRGNFLSWVIGGGESGLHARDADVLRQRFMVERDAAARWQPRADRAVWAQSLRDATKAVGAAFWWKQWGGPRPTSGGRVLDGRTWDELPAHVAGAMPEAYDHTVRQTKHMQLPMLT